METLKNFKEQFVENTKKLIETAKQQISKSKARVQKATENLTAAKIQGDYFLIATWSDILETEQKGLCCDVEYCDSLIADLKKLNH